MTSTRDSSRGSVELADTDRPGFRRSPTLDLAERVEHARRNGQPALSLSTPTFTDAEGAPVGQLALRTKLTPAEGDLGLREVARAKLFARWNLNSHQIMVSAGAKAAIFAALKAVVPAPSPVIIVAPAWPSYEDLVRLAGLEPVFYETSVTSGFAVDEASLHERMRVTGARAILLSNPSNPTGRICASQELQALARAAAASKAWLMLDESFSHVVFDEAAWRQSTVASAPNLIVFNSFSKNYHLQGLRVGVAMAHESRFSDIVAVHQTLMSAASSQSQAIALASLAASAGDARHYLASREIALRILARAGWQSGPSQGAFHLFPHVGDVERIQERLQAEGVYALAGRTFGEAYGEHIRFCFGRPEAEMTEIERRLDKTGLLGRR